jgi:hypothetical protein
MLSHSTGASGRDMEWLADPLTRAGFRRNSCRRRWRLLPDPGFRLLVPVWNLRLSLGWRCGAPR